MENIFTHTFPQASDSGQEENHAAGLRRTPNVRETNKTESKTKTKTITATGLLHMTSSRVDSAPGPIRPLNPFQISE